MRSDQLRRRVARRGFDVAGLLTGVVLMTAACGDPLPSEPGLTGGWSTAGCEFSRVPQSTVTGTTTIPVTPPELEAVIARIEKAGRADFADSYAGIEVDQQDVRAIVHRVPSAEFDDFIRQAAENTCVTVHDAAHTLADLTTWQNRLVNDLPEWTAAGIQIYTVGARHDGAGVEIGTADVRTTKDQLQARYGETAPFLYQEQPPVHPLTPPPGN
jgi:hypothetical protein